MKKCLPVVVFILFLSQSCTSKDQVWKNEAIDPKVKATMTALNGEIYAIMCENNYEKLTQLFSDTLMNQLGPDFAKKFMPNMQQVMKGHNYRVFDEFYIKCPKAKDTITLASGKGDSAYTIKFASPAPQTYFAMLVAGDTTDEVMLTLVYTNINGKWKVSNLYGENYSLRSKNAVEQYYYAMGQQKNGYLLDAACTMALAKNCIAPGGRTFQYKKTAEITHFSDSITKETDEKYMFPYTMNEIKSKPEIVNVHYQILAGSFVPIVIYKSTINVADTVSLKKENDIIQKGIGKQFYGIDLLNKTILYRAYNELPNGNNDPRYYGYVQRIP